MTELQGAELIALAHKAILALQLIAFFAPITLGVLLFLCYRSGRK